MWLNEVTSEVIYKETRIQKPDRSFIPDHRALGVISSLGTVKREAENVAQNHIHALNPGVAGTNTTCSKVLKHKGYNMYVRSQGLFKYFVLHEPHSKHS